MRHPTKKYLGSVRVIGRLSRIQLDGFSVEINCPFPVMSGKGLVSFVFKCNSLLFWGRHFGVGELEGVAQGSVLCCRFAGVRRGKKSRIME